MNDFLSDLRYAARMLAKNPGFAVIAILALALGIGANTAIFSVVNAVLLRPLPFEQPEQLVSLGEKFRGHEALMHSTNPLNFLDWRDASRSFSGMAAFFQTPMNLSRPGEPAQVSGLYVSADFWPILGVQPELGRWFRPDEDRPTGDKPALLSHALWKSRFGGDPATLGRTLSLNDVTYHVIGVMPSGFDLPQSKADLWIPAEIDRASSQHEGRYLDVVARLRQGASMEQARLEMAGIAARLARSRPFMNATASVDLTPLATQVSGNARVPLLALLGAVGFVLLIACANVGNLLLLRAEERRGEMAVRSALGASRCRILRQVLAESCLLSVIASVMGVVLAAWAIAGLATFLPAEFVSTRASAIRIDRNVLLFTLILTMLTALSFAVISAFPTFRLSPQPFLKQSESRFSAAGSRSRSALVICEIAVTVVLLIGAGLLSASLNQLLTVDTGFQPAHRLTMRMMISPTRHAWGKQIGVYTAQILDRLRAVPAVQAAGSIHFLPFSGLASGSGFRRMDRPAPAPGAWPDARFSVVSPGFFAAMGIPVLRGRDFVASDEFGTPGAVAVNQSFADTYFPNENPIGKQLGLQWTFVENAHVIGVVGNIRQNKVSAPPEPTIYLSVLQSPNLNASLVVRTAADPRSVTRDIVAAIRQIDAEQPVADIAVMDEIVSASLARPRFQSFLTGLFALLALVLACLGTYAVLSYSVARRKREFAIRSALGAQPAQLTQPVISEVLRLAGSGIAMGLIGAFVVSRAIASLLFNVSPRDPMVFAGSSCILLAIALAASWIPARRAAHADPMTALRHE